MECGMCGKEYEEETNEDRLCTACNAIHKAEIERIGEIVRNGHSQHCACRQVWGDGECECDLYEKGYDPYAWIKG